MATNPSQNFAASEYILTYDTFANGTVHLLSCPHLKRAKRLAPWPQARGMSREGIRMLINAGWSELFPTVVGLDAHVPIADDWDYDWDYWEQRACVIYPIRICRDCLPDQYSVSAHLH